MLLVKRGELICNTKHCMIKKIFLGRCGEGLVMLRSSALLVSLPVTVVTVITHGNSLFITIKIINDICNNSKKCGI